MPLPLSMDATWLDGSVQFNGQELRRADSALFTGTGAALGVQGGIVRHSDTSLAVTVNASDVITVQPGAVVIPGNEGTANGVYRTALGTADTGTLTARNATNPRIDRVIYRVLDTSVVGSHGAYTGRIEVLTGTAAVSPEVPALPTLAVELARINVPASGGGTAVVDSSFREYAAAIGGILPVATAARLPSTPNAKWLKAVAVDTGREYTWDGTAWRGSPFWKSFTPVLTAASGGAALGNATVVSKYVENGDLIHFTHKITMGSTTTYGSGGFLLNLPVAIGTNAPLNANVQFQNVESGQTLYYSGTTFLEGGTTFRLGVVASSGAQIVSATATAPFTWGAGDIITVNGWYERA